MAKKAIHTFKDHFIGVLSGCAPTFPMHLWCQLLPQVEQQLLLLQQSQLHQLIHLCAHLWPPRLQQTSIHSNWDGGPCTQQTTQTLNLCRTLQKGVCLWHVHQTLSVLEILINGNPHYLNLRRCIFQAQIPDKPVVYPRGLSNCRG
jgi:hypothetical protein